MNWKYKLVVCVLIPLSGCATIVSGPDEKIIFDSSPSGARVDANGIEIGWTPFSRELSRSEEYSVVFSKDGYKDKTAIIENSLNPWCFGNIIFGGIIGAIVDACTGSINQLSPDHLSLTLDPIPQLPIPDKPDVEGESDMDHDAKLMGQLSNLKKLRDQGVLSEDEYQFKREKLVDQLIERDASEEEVEEEEDVYESSITIKEEENSWLSTPASSDEISALSETGTSTIPAEPEDIYLPAETDVMPPSPGPEVIHASPVLELTPPPPIPITPVPVAEVNDTTIEPELTPIPRIPKASATPPPQENWMEGI